MLNQVKSRYASFQITQHLWSFLIGLTCGMPYNLTSSTLIVWLSEAHVPIFIITVMKFLNLTYLLKFSWAPMFDHYQPIGFGKYKSWIIYTHFLLGAASICMSYVSPDQNFKMFVLCSSITAFVGANVTLALDSYWIRFIDKDNVQEFAGITEVGYRLGKIITGGIALIIADALDWHILYQISGIFFFILTGFLAFLPDIKDSKTHKKRKYNYKRMMTTCWYALYRYGGSTLMFFLLTVKINEALEHNLLPVFMLQELGLSKTSIGIITKIIGIIANMIGLMIAIKSIRNIGYKRTLTYAIQLHLLGTVLLSLISIFHISDIQEIVVVCLIDNIARGLISTTLLSFFADKVATIKSATQFSMFALVTGCSGIVFAPLGGLIVDHFGWSAFFIFSAFATLPSYFTISRLKDSLTT